MDSADKWISLFAFKLCVPINNKSNIPPLAFNCSHASSVINKNAESTYNLRNPLTFADSAYKFCGFHLQLRNPEQLAIFFVAESATKQMCRQNLRYSYMYAESAEILFVESTYILEHISRLVSGIQEHTDTKLCSYPCTVWPRNDMF